MSNTTIRPVVWRWTRRVALLVGRWMLAVASVIVAVYGLVQLSTVVVRAMLPLSPPPSTTSTPFMSYGETLTALEAVPPVHLFGPVVIDPVLNTESVQTVVVAVGLVGLSALGMTVATTAPRLRQRTASVKESSLSAALPSVHDAFALFDKPQSEVAQNAKLFFEQTAACVVLWWTATEILIPMLADAGAVVLLLVLHISVRIIPAVGAVSIVLAVAHTGWYARLRWQAEPTAGGVDS